MNHLTWVNWCVTGTEGLLSMLKTFERDNIPITQEMCERLNAAADEIKRIAERSIDRIEDKR